MIDYDATLKEFFNDVLKYLNKRAKNAKDKRTQESIFDAIWAVKTIAENPKMYADYNVRVKAGLEDHSIIDGFMAGTQDNSVYLKYSSVLHKMGDLDNVYDFPREQAQLTLLRAKKFVEYKNSTNFLKDFIFSFRSNESFGVKVKQK